MPASSSDLAACRALLRDGSRTFYAASFLLPRSAREPASVLYAFCRLADDAVDAGNATSALPALRERLERIYEGRPLAIPADRAFATVVERHRIPRPLPEALLDGFAWDAEGRRYETLEDLQAYAARVAGSVGAMMALVMGAHSTATVARACELGVAMQLSNVARDVGEDARAGRLYLPLAWLREAGIDPGAFLARPAPSDALASVVARLVAAADALYARAASGIAELPVFCRPAMRAAALLYAEIGRTVVRRGGDSVTRRAVVPASCKARLLLFSLFPPLVVEFAHAPLPGIRFLVEALPTRAVEPREPPFWDMGARLVRTIELFERLERLERARA